MLDIIIVEDNQEIAGLLCDFLRKENYSVSVASSGEQALERFEKYGARLIILDISLPGVDGFAVCTKIRETSNAHIMIAGFSVRISGKRCVMHYEIKYCKRQSNNIEVNGIFHSLKLFDTYINREYD